MNSSDGSSRPTAPSPWNIGNGFIEIAALTSLIGSAAAQTLALGGRGPAGLVWATLTIFGGMSVVKAGVATVAPDWMRDSLGVRTSETDAAVGLSLNLDGSGSRYRLRAGVAKGVECELGGGGVYTDLRMRRDVQIFDQRTQNVIKATPPSEPGDPLKVYFYRRDPYHKEIALQQAWVDGLGLALSAIKVIEVLTLRMYDAIMLSWVSLGTWLFFLVAGLVLIIHHHSENLLKPKHRRVVDAVVTDAVPVPSSRGGFRKVVLGIPRGERHDLVWKAVWALSAVASSVSVISTYLALGQAPDARVFFIWTSFQLLYIGLRSTFFHLIDDRERPYLASLVGKPIGQLEFQEKVRVQHLVHALAKYQYHIHPRGHWSYNEDMKAMTRLSNIWAEYPKSATVGGTVCLHVDGVIGDTIISSASWICGSTLGGFDFYDTCIVLLNINGQHVAIPAARVLSAMRPVEARDTEKGDDVERPARGGSNRGVDIDWWFWIPYAQGKWLHFKSEKVKFNGSRNASILTDLEVTERLKRGDLYISMKHVDEIKEVVKSSTVASRYIQELMS